MNGAPTMMMRVGPHYCGPGFIRGKGRHEWRPYGGGICRGRIITALVLYAAKGAINGAPTMMMRVGAALLRPWFYTRQRAP